MTIQEGQSEGEFEGEVWKDWEGLYVGTFRNNKLQGEGEAYYDREKTKLLFKGCFKDFCRAPIRYLMVNHF